jgi:hypothetical protein
VSHIKKFHIVANPNLGFETTAEEFAAGIEKTRRMLEEYVPVEGACVREEIFDAALRRRRSFRFCRCGCISNMNGTT